MKPPYTETIYILRIDGGSIIKHKITRDMIEEGKSIVTGINIIY